MFSSKHYINIISLFIVTFAAAAYVLKYSILYSEYPWLITGAFIILFWIANILVERFIRIKYPPGEVKYPLVNILIIGSLTLITVFVIGIFEISFEYLHPAEFFINSVLSIVLIFLCETYLDKEKITLYYFLFGLLFGLMLFLRSIFILVFLIYSLYLFRHDLQKALILISLMIIGYFIFYLILGNLAPKAFMINNPFSIYPFLFSLPSWFYITIFVLVIYCGWIVSDLQELFFASGLILFLTALFSTILLMMNVGFEKTIIEDSMNFFYIAFSIPFFIMAIKDYKVDRFLGKILIEDQILD